MEWIQPAFFWGLLGISVPLAIHLWNGRRGKVIAWAATAWLNPQESQSSRSLRLDQWVLLLVRILFWALLVLMVVGLLWKTLDESDSPRIIHLLVPNQQVEAEFRFELERAIEKGEDVFWLTEGLPAYEVGEAPSMNFDSEKTQEYLDLLPRTLDSLHVYAAGLESELVPSRLWVPKSPQFHLATQLSPPVPSEQLIQLESGDLLGLNEQGILVPISSEAGIPEDRMAYSGPIPVHFALADGEKKEQLQAALVALQEVYGLSFAEVALEKAKVVFADQLSKDQGSEALYFYTAPVENTKTKLHIPLDNPVSIPWSEAVEKGILPELIVSPLLEFLGIRSEIAPLSQSHLEQKFVEIPKAKSSIESNTTEIFLVLIVLCFGLERFLAYRNNL
jgi:hypothetical protein